MKVCERPDLAPSCRAIVGNNGFERIEDSKGTLPSESVLHPVVAF